MPERVVIIGAGHAAGQCAASLRQQGWTGEIYLVGEEAYPPYQRPPLSKAFLAGALTEDRLFLKPDAFYEKEKIDLRLGVRAEAIDRAAKEVRLSDGETLTYAKLVIATGARVKRLPLPGATLAGVGYLRDIADVQALQAQFSKGARLAIVGAGYIGLEVAAIAAKAGLHVTVLEAADRVMSRVTSAPISEFFEELHRAHAVDIRLGAAIEGFEGAGRVEEIKMSGGERIACDFAVIGVGVAPNDDLAARAGLAVNDGVLVDIHTQTEDPDIFAIGDCTRHPSAYYGGLLRLESVHNALEQAKTAAATICGRTAVYDEAPWFWSDQYDVKLQTVGICKDRYDTEIMRGDPAEKKFSMFYMRSGRLIAVDSVNAPADHMIARKIIAVGGVVDPEFLRDPSTDLKALLA